MKTILIASKNSGKINEYKAMLEPLGIQIKSLLDFPDIPDIEETGATFLENAKIKAEKVATVFDLPCLADDSGLEVLTLNGAPGVYSQRYSKEGIPKTNNAKLIRELQGKTDRRARFVCVIVFFSPKNGYQSFEGTVEGEIIDQPRGTRGFGYDPHFYLKELNQTFAELSLETKNQLSHRGKALRKLIEWLKENEDETNRLLG